MTDEAYRRGVLAAFTLGRRRHRGLSQAALARQLGIRPDQVLKAECARPCGADARATLARWNGIEEFMCGDNAFPASEERAGRSGRPAGGLSRLPDDQSGEGDAAREAEGANHARA